MSAATSSLKASKGISSRWKLLIYSALSLLLLNLLLFASNGGREVRPYAHVDDDPAILESTGDVVEAFIGITGWQYLTCSQLLSDLVRVHYVVVIVDYNSRLDLNGDVCTERILQIDPQTIIIGHSNNEMEAVFKRAGARYFISKTGGPLILIDLLKSLLGL